MAPPVSEIDIKNLALLGLQQKPFTSFDDTDSPAVITVNLLYDQCRRELLTSDLWNFARRRAYLTLDTVEKPLFDYLGAYLLPNDVLKIHHIGTEYDLWDPPHYDKQGRYIYYAFAQDYATAPNSIAIEYTKDITDPTQMDPLFIKAFTAYLTFRLCMPLTGNFKVLGALKDLYEVARAEATAINHLERPLRVIDRDYISAARAGVDGDLDEEWRVPKDAWPS